LRAPEVNDGPPRHELEQWLRDRLEEAHGTLLGQGYQATVHHYATPFGDVVVKSPHAAAIVGLIGRHAIRREYEVYRRLFGIAGVPRVFGLIDGSHLVLEAVSGRSLRERQHSLVDRERFFARLIATIDAMHAAGVAHGDLKRKDNVLVGPDERPYVIDFGVAVLRKDGAPLNRPHFELIKQMDVNAWIKLKYAGRSEPLSAADAARYRRLWIERLARWIRIPWQTVTLRRPRQRWRARRRDRR
jgi:predicted Ser/Thr protein kinase